MSSNEIQSSAAEAITPPRELPYYNAESPENGDGAAEPIDYPVVPSKLDDDQISHDSEEHEEGHQFERYPLCCRPILQFFADLVPYGGIVSNVFSLCSVTLGGAIISMPSSFAMTGIAMSTVYLIVITFLTVYTMTMMGMAMRVTGGRNFEECGDMLFGRGWSYFVGGVMWLSCIGTAIAYINAAVSLVTPLLIKSNASDFFKSDAGIYIVVVILWVVLLVPITIPKRINSVRYVSVIGVSMVLYFVVCLIIHGSISIHEEGLKNDLVWFASGNDGVYGLSIFIFAYMCQGVAYSVYYEMKPEPSVRQLTVASGIGMTLCMVFYIMAGFFGYAAFGSETMSSVLYNFDPIHQKYIFVAYVGMLIKICAAYGMNMIPVRNFQYHCLGWELETTPYWKHTIMILFTSSVVLVLGLFLNDINTAFGLVGSLCGGFIGFLFPAFFWMYCGHWSMETVGIWHWIGTWVIIFSGVVAICFGTVATIYFTIKG